MPLPWGGLKADWASVHSHTPAGARWLQIWWTWSSHGCLKFAWLLGADGLNQCCWSSWGLDMGVEWSLKFRPKSLLEDCVSRTQALAKGWVVWTTSVYKGWFGILYLWLLTLHSILSKILKLYKPQFPYLKGEYGAWKKKCKAIPFKWGWSSKSHNWLFYTLGEEDSFCMTSFDIPCTLLNLTQYI